MDNNLQDDMLKLVRYKILFVKREYELAFPEREDLVSENMDGSAFAGWKVAEFIQELGRGETPVPKRWLDKGYPKSEFVKDGKLLGLTENDKKYLRVYYEVLERYPRQKFKYEERQIRVLEQIRDGLAKDGKPAEPSTSSAFDDIAARVQANKVRLKYLRQGFQLCHERLATDVSNAYAKFRDLGEFQAIKVTKAELQQAFKQGIHTPFDPAGLESFPGRWRGINRKYDFTGKEMEADVATWNMTWEKGVLNKDGYVQRVIGSKIRHYTSPELPPLSERKVDLALNVYQKDIGITGWLSAWVEFRNELALISYELHKGTFLWIGQMLSEKLEPIMGDKIFWMFLEWFVPGASKPTYYMYGLMFEIDFDACEAKIFGDNFRKSRFDYLD